MEWQIIIKNPDTLNPVTVDDLGWIIGAGETVNAHEQFDFGELAGSEDLRTLVAAGTLIVNDGSADLSATDGVAWLKRASKKYVDDQVADAKSYADSIASGFKPKAPVEAATTAALPACTYDNGTGGVGATLTAAANGALPAIDGVTLAVGDSVLVKDQADAKQNGAYTVTALGDASNPWVLTRRTDFDGSPSNEVTPGARFYVSGGSANAGAAFTLLGDVSTTLTVGTDPLTFGQTAGEAATANLQAELDATQAGAGLGTDGSYQANSGANYISGATSLADADNKLDAALKGVDNRVATLEAGVVSDLAVINGVVCGRDTNRGKWLGFRSTLTFGRHGKPRNTYLKLSGELAASPGNSVALPNAATLVGATLSVKQAPTADATVEIRKSSGAAVATLNLAAGSTQVVVSNMNVDVAAGERLSAFVGAVGLKDPVLVLQAAYNGGSL